MDEPEEEKKIVAAEEPIDLQPVKEHKSNPILSSILSNSIPLKSSLKSRIKKEGERKKNVSTSNNNVVRSVRLDESITDMEYVSDDNYDEPESISHADEGGMNRIAENIEPADGKLITDLDIQIPSTDLGSMFNRGVENPIENPFSDTNQAQEEKGEEVVHRKRSSSSISGGGNTTGSKGSDPSTGNNAIKGNSMFVASDATIQSHHSNVNAPAFNTQKLKNASVEEIYSASSNNLDRTENDFKSSEFKNSNVSIDQSINSDNGMQGNRKIGSIHSLGSTNSATGGKGKELVETFFVKVRAIKSILFAILSNLVLLFLLLILASDKGLKVTIGNIDPSLLYHAGPIFLQTWMHLVHGLTEEGIHVASGVFFGYLITRVKGYSLAVCGYNHASLFEKLAFPGYLSFKSTCKVILYRLNYLWVFHVLVLVLTVFSSSGISNYDDRYDSGSLGCATYGQDGAPFDRGFPNIDAAMGVGEYVFGTSLGHMRSEESVDYTIHVFPSQLTDVCNDGTTIVGGGFRTNILTSCTCATSTSRDAFLAAGVDERDVDAIMDAFNNGFTAPVGMVNAISPRSESDGNAMNITSVLKGMQFCGGLNQTSPPTPVCFTQMWDHWNVEVVGEYMTDGSPASIAIKAVTIRQDLEEADMSWLYQAYLNALGGRITILDLPQTFPGATNPLLWWTTINMQSVSPSFLEPGIETTFSMLSRTAIQRSYSVRASLCIKNVKDSGVVIMKIMPRGYIVGLIFCLSQLLINLISLCATVPWFLLSSENPIGPGIRVASDRLYFSMLLTGPLTAGSLADATGTPAEIWPKLDFIVRVGESLSTKDDPEFGKITMDKPKLVTSFVRAKLYS